MAAALQSIHRRTFTKCGYFVRCKTSAGDGTHLPLALQDITNILQANEFTKEFPSGSIKSFDTNYLASNSPIEDASCESQCLLTRGYLFGIFDGHGGAACAQVLSRRLLEYVAASLLPRDVLSKYLNATKREDLILRFNDKTDLVEDIKPIYEKSLRSFLTSLYDSEITTRSVEDVLKLAITSIDADLSKEVLTNYNERGVVDRRLLSVAMSGAVSCIAHVNGAHLHVANVGDSSAVLGTMTENNEWMAVKLAVEHNIDNIQEVNRIISEHPNNEHETVIKADRLLGQLAPLRALGDFRYKWSQELMQEIVVKYLGKYAIPPNYYTPPYLSSMPDVTYHQLTPKDKFLIIASDGLWDILTPLQVVTLVGEHMLGKVFFTPMKLTQKDVKLGEIGYILKQRQEGLKMKPEDSNAATHLLRHALGGTDQGIDNQILSDMLNLSPDISRRYRDDITITVIFFNEDYLRQRSTLPDSPAI